MMVHAHTHFALVYTLFFLVSQVTVHAQTLKNPPSANQSNGDQQIDGNTPPPSPVSEAVQPLPGGFDEIQLGTDLTTVKTLLKNNSLFRHREVEILSLSSNNSRILSVEGTTFIDYGYFVFDENDSLISLSLFLDHTQLDYGTMYQVFSSKYGEPSIDPQKAVWANDMVSIMLVKPLHITYVLEGAFESSKTERSSEQKLRQEERSKFLQLF